MTSCTIIAFVRRISPSEIFLTKLYPLLIIYTPLMKRPVAPPLVSSIFILWERLCYCEMLKFVTFLSPSFPIRIISAITEVAMPYNILIIEDEPDINLLLTKILTTAGYTTAQAYSGTEARLLLEREQPDLILLDLMLPGLSGQELLFEIRETMRSSIPVLVLSAKSSLNDKVTLLTSGADDYITKPFEPEEIIARIQAALRRTLRNIHSPALLSCKNLTLCPDTRKVLVNGTELSLTVREFDLLHLFLQTPEKVYSREHLYELVWKGGYYGENNTVNVHVSNLRKKLKSADPKEEYIQTVYGIGFKLCETL